MGQTRSSIQTSIPATLSAASLQSPEPPGVPAAGPPSESQAGLNRDPRRPPAARRRPAYARTFPCDAGPHGGSQGAEIRCAVAQHSRPRPAADAIPTAVLALVRKRKKARVETLAFFAFE